MGLSLRIPHEGRRHSPGDRGRRWTRVRSAALCPAPSVGHQTPPEPGHDTPRRPPARPSRDVPHPSRPRTSRKRRTPSRPSGLTIPIRCAAPSHAASSNRVYPHGAGTGVGPVSVAVRMKPYSLGRCARNWIEWRDDLSAPRPFGGLNLSEILHNASEVVVQRCGKSFARGANLGDDGVIRER